MKPPPTTTHHNQHDITRIVNALNELHIPPSLSIRKTARILRNTGHPVRQSTLSHAIRMRRALHLPPL
jgi:hypothetical protein